MNRIILGVLTCFVTICGNAADQPANDPIKEASIAFKANPLSRTKHAEVLFPVIKKGMKRADVVLLLGKPNGGEAAISEPSLYYTVFYSQILEVHFKDDRVVSTHAVGFADQSKNAQ